MGQVAKGTVCVGGRILGEGRGNCSPVGKLLCGPSGKTFYLCDYGGLVDMGRVADGTVCVDGGIVADE